MSAITKSHVHFAAAIGTDADDVLVLAEQIITAEVFNVPAFQNTPAQYGIKIVLSTPTSTIVKDFYFVDATARNTSMTNLKSALSTSIA
jgi:hypothetical protein